MSIDIQKQLINNGSWDVIVIGAGAAGLMTCLELPPNLNVLLLNRNTSKRSSSRWAQGGIASVTRPEDSMQTHLEDTVKDCLSRDNVFIAAQNCSSYDNGAYTGEVSAKMLSNIDK